MLRASHKFAEKLRRAFGDAEFCSPYAPEPETLKVVYASSMVINLLALALPLTILQVYDRVLPNASFTTLNALLAGLIAVILIDLILKYARSYVVNWAGASYTHKTSSKAVNVILSTNPSHYHSTPVAQHLSQLSAINGVGDYVSGLSRIVKIDMLFIPVFALVIFIIGGPLLLVPVTLFTVFAFFSIRQMRQLRTIIEDREKVDSYKNDFIIEALTSIPTVKSLSMEPSMMRRFERLQLRASDVVRRMVEFTSATQTSATMFSSLSTVSIVGFGAILVIYGQLTLGGLACCMLLSSQLIQPLTKIVSAWNQIQYTDFHRQEVHKIFENHAEAAAAPPPAAIRIPRPAGVEIKNMTIQYGSAKPLFENINVAVGAGEFVAVRGGDGSGRTSLLRAMSGAVIPAKGGVRINGVLLTEENAPAIRQAVRYISQEPAIFRGTILENLTIFGKTPTATCLAASKLIGLDNEIIHMPLGYDTKLENATGGDIPASTAQRIAIARALALQPSVLIFDEANTSLDMPGEKALLVALQKLKRNMTIIMATHRPSLIGLADRAFEIVDGSVVPFGASEPQQKAGAI